MELSILDSLEKAFLLASIRPGDNATNVISIGTKTGHEFVGCDLLNSHETVWWKVHFPYSFT